MVWDVLSSYRLSTRLTTKETISDRCSNRQGRIDRQVTVTTMTRTVETSRRGTRPTVGTLIWREPMLRGVQLAAAWPEDVGQHMHLESGGQESGGQEGYDDDC